MTSASPLAGHATHLWRIDLGGPAPRGVESTLDASELSRASRFAFDRDRHRFLWARVAVRDILGAYVGCTPRELAFRTDANGKPHLVRGMPWAFNLSHSGDIGVLAVARETPVGVDVETLESVRDARLLAHSLCTEAEMRSLESLSGFELTRAFLTCWTRKEACLKAIGTGLALPPKEIEVGTTTECRRVVVQADASRHVSVATVDAGDDCIAALARAEGPVEWKVFAWNGKSRN